MTEEISSLIRKLQVGSDRDRIEAAEMLGEARATEAVEPLMKCLEAAGDFDLVEKAAIALGKIGDRSAVPALIETLRTRRTGRGNENIRWRIAEALGKLGDPSAIEPLLVLMEDRFRFVRESAGEAIRTLGGGDKIDAADARAVEALMAKLEGPEAAEAALQLGSMGVTAAADKLIALLESRSVGVAEAAARALEQLKDPRAVEPLIRCLESDHLLLRCSAAGALGAIGDRRAVPALMRTLQYNDWGVRNRAAMALGAIGDRQAEQVLRAAASADSDRGVRASAGEALKRLK